MIADRAVGRNFRFDMYSGKPEVQKSIHVGAILVGAG